MDHVNSKWWILIVRPAQLSRLNQQLYMFTLDVKSVLNGNLGGILGGTQC